MLMRSARNSCSGKKFANSIPTKRSLKAVKLLSTYSSTQEQNLMGAASVRARTGWVSQLSSRQNMLWPDSYRQENGSHEQTYYWINGLATMGNFYTSSCSGAIVTVRDPINSAYGIPNGGAKGVVTWLPTAATITTSDKVAMRRIRVDASMNDNGHNGHHHDDCCWCSELHGVRKKGRRNNTSINWRLDDVVVVFCVFQELHVVRNAVFDFIEHRITFPHCE